MISWLIISYLAFFFQSLQFETPIWPEIARSLGTLEANLGIINVVKYVLLALTAACTSLVIQKLSVKRTIVLGLMFEGLSIFILSFSKSFGFFLFIISFAYIGMELINSTVGYYINLIYHPKFLSWMHACYGIGGAVGAIYFSKLISLNIDFRVGYRIISPFLIILALIIVIYKYVQDRILKKRLTSKKEKNKKPPVDFKKILTTKNAILYYMCFFWNEFTICVVCLWFPTFLVMSYEKIGLTTAKASEIFSLYFVGMVASRLLIGFIEGKIGKEKILYVGYFLTFIGLILFALSKGNNSCLIMAVFLFGFGMGPTSPIMTNIAKDIFGDDQLRGAMGLIVFFSRVGSMLSGVLIGYALLLFGNGSYYIILVLGIIVSVLTFTKLVSLVNIIKEKNPPFNFT